MKYIPAEKTKKGSLQIWSDPGVFKNNQFKFILCFLP